MPYATIDEILSRVDRRSPYPPGQFPDFDPEDLKAWAYFIHVYLDFSQGTGWFASPVATRTMEWPAFLPRYNEGAGRVDDLPPLARLSHLEELRKILDYVSYCMGVWRIKPAIIPGATRILGFSIDSDDDYNGCFQRAKDARDVAWEKVMSYSARRLYPYADPWERPGGPNVVASGDQEDGEDVAFILPDITLLYLEANREWQQVFGDIGSGRIEIQAGYRTQNWQRRVSRARQSAHVAGAAIDVLPPQVFMDCFPFQKDNYGKRISIGYLCWLFRRAAQNSPYFREIVVLNRGQPNETRVPRMPKTLCEPGTAHISFGWLLHAVGSRDVRQDVLPSVTRPYPVDANDPDAGTDVPTSRTRDEFQGPGRLDHLWDVFDPTQYATLNFGAISNQPDYSGGISAQWLAGYINEALNNRGWDFGRLIRQHHVGRLDNQDARIGQID